MKMSLLYQCINSTLTTVFQDVTTGGNLEKEYLRFLTTTKESASTSKLILKKKMGVRMGGAGKKGREKKKGMQEVRKA